MSFLRVGGRFETDDGATVIWNVAEGARGRRWRWVRTAPDGRTLSALLEVAPDGRPARLEVAAPAGLLVLHPEPDGREAHGNVVGAAGVRPLAFAWGPGHLFDVVGLPWVAAACAFGGSVPAVERHVVVVDADLDVVAATRIVTPLPDDLPDDGARWPLE